LRHRIWSRQKEILKQEHGITWFNQSEMNPNVIFDSVIFCAHRKSLSTRLFALPSIEHLLNLKSLTAAFVLPNHDFRP